MQKLVWQNANGDSIDLTSGNYGITQWEGFSNTSLNIQSQQVPFQDGAVFLDALLNQRELSVTLKMQDNGNLEERYRMRRELIHILNPKLGEGYLIYTNDFISKRIKCIPQIPLFETHNSDTRGTPKASLSWTACEPYWEDLEETELAFAKNEILQIQNEGDVKSQMEIIISSNGELVNPVISNENGEYIKYNGSVSEILKINTNFGKKEVCKYKSIKSLLNTAYPNAPIYSSELKLFLWYRTFFMTSKDYVNWEIQNAPAGTPTLNTGVYSEHLHSFFLYGHYSNRQCIYSNNGIEWERVILDIPGNLDKVIYSEEKQEFLGYYRTNNITTIIKSIDGLNWQTLYTTSAFIKDIIWSSRVEKYLIATDTEIFTSTDGSTWTSQTLIPTGIVRLDKFTEGANNIIISAFTNTNIRIILTSTNDATQWDTTVNYGENIGVQGAYNSKTGFYLIINSDSTVLKSSDGIAWLKYKINDIDLQQVQYINDMSLFVTSTGFVSKDGIDWVKNFTIRNPELGTSMWNSIYVEKTDTFLAVEYNPSSCRLFRSKDLKNWSYIDLPTTARYIRKIIYIDELKLYLIIGDYNKIFTSKDSFNWEQQNTGMANTITYFDVKYFEKKIIVVGTNGTILISEDGENWVQKTSSINETLYSISYSKKNDIYVIAGAKNNIITSQDCENWTLRTNPVNYRNIYSVIYSNKRQQFVAISASTTNEYTEFLISVDGIEWDKLNEINIKYQQIVCSDIFNCFFCIGTNIAKSVDLINFDSVNTTALSSLGVTFMNFAEKKGYGVFITGSNNTQVIYEIGDKTNVIQNMDKNSNINMGLNIGYNRLYLDSDEGDFNTTIRYRQKYIGV